MQEIDENKTTSLANNSQVAYHYRVSQPIENIFDMHSKVRRKSSSPLLNTSSQNTETTKLDEPTKSDLSIFPKSLQTNVAEAPKKSSSKNVQ